jgi:hypothetical protein
MRQVTVTCDRCAVVINEGAAVLTVEAGNLRDGLHNPVDLCPECSRKLLEWLTTAQMARGEGR